MTKRSIGFTLVFSLLISCSSLVAAQAYWIVNGECVAIGCNPGNQDCAIYSTKIVQNQDMYNCQAFIDATTHTTDDGAGFGELESFPTICGANIPLDFYLQSDNSYNGYQGGGDGTLLSVCYARDLSQTCFAGGFECNWSKAMACWENGASGKPRMCSTWGRRSEITAESKIVNATETAQVTAEGAKQLTALEDAKREIKWEG